MRDGWEVEYSESGRRKDRVSYGHLSQGYRTRLEFGAPEIRGRKAALACARALLDDLRETHPKAAVFLDGVRVRQLDPNERLAERAAQAAARRETMGESVQLAFKMARKDGGGRR